MTKSSSLIAGYLKELKRRKVLRVGAVYLLIGWLILQIAEVTFDPLRLPDWALTLAVVLVALGFPVALILAWALELTPEGIRRERQAEEVADTTRPVAAEGPSVAVLPFEDMSEERDQAYFCEGMADEITSALTAIDRLRVASRTSAFQFRGTSVDSREIGRRLGVRALVEGSVRKSGKHLRISAELIDVADGYVMWSRTIDRELQDVFAIQEEIAKDIAEALELSLSPREQQAIQQQAPTASVEAYDYYLRGRNYYYQYSRQGARFALEMFTRAIELDEDFALAYAGIADACSYLYLNGDNSQANKERSEFASAKALELDPDLAPAHVSRGVVLFRSQQHEQAQREFEKALELGPDSFEAHYFYARECFVQGDLERAMRLYERACELQPEDYQSPLLLAAIYEELGRLEEAGSVRRRGVAVTEEHLKKHPDEPRAWYMGANGLMSLGERRKALEWARRAYEQDPEEPMLLYNLACVYTRAGESGQALDFLENAVTLGFANRGWMEQDPDLKPLRDLPRFVKLARSLDRRSA